MWTKKKKKKKKLIYKISDNPNTFAGLVGKVRKKLSPEGGRKGGWSKNLKRAQRARRTRGSNPAPAAC